MAIITLTSDINPQDFVLGATKGMILQQYPHANIVDIAHGIEPFNYSQTAYIFGNALPFYPDFCFHLILVNLFDLNKRQLLLGYYRQQYIFCADNGLLGMLLPEKPEVVMGIPIPGNEPLTTMLMIKTIASTIQRIESGENLLSIGEADVHYRENIPLQPVVNTDYLEGQIVYIDHFENVVVNINRQLFERERKGRKFFIQIGRNNKIDKISESYASVPEGHLLAMFNSSGLLEIAMNRGKAASMFGMIGFSNKTENSFLRSKLVYQTVKIFFS